MLFRFIFYVLFGYFCSFNLVLYDGSASCLVFDYVFVVILCCGCNKFHG